MALNIKIDLDNRYLTRWRHPNQVFSEFESELKEGRRVRMGIRISPNAHPMMPNVYNLAFGPLDQNNEINDQVKLTHKDYSKVFSTVVFEALSFLAKNPDRFIGIDGSNTARAYMYYRCLQNNYAYLSGFFNVLGIKYYVRLLRPTEDDQYDFDEEDLITIPAPIRSNEQVQAGKLYNYFIMNLKRKQTIKDPNSPFIP